MALAAPKRLLDCSHRVWVLITDKGRWHRFATPVHAQPAAPGPPPRTAVSIDQSAVFDVTPVTGALKETVQKGQRLVWRARRSPNDRRFELTDMSVAFLRSDAPTQVKITFAGHVSAFGWRPNGRSR
jgi:hypothetical protein